MSFEIRVPLLPESVNDAVVASWLKQVGDQVKEGDILCELETDKVMLEVPAVEGGVLQEILCETGSKVKAEQVLATVEQGVAAKEPVKLSSSPSSDTQAKVPSDPPISPSVRRSLHANDFAKDAVIGSGKHGRVEQQDVAGAVSDKEAREPTKLAINDATELERVPMTRMRARIAQRLLASQQQTASLTTFNEVDMTKVMELRANYKDLFIKKHGVKLGFMSFFVHACAKALQAFPVVNAYVDGEDIVYNKHAHIGIAVSTDKGLVVPVLHHADNMSMHEVEGAIGDYAVKAKSSKLTLDDMSGGTFTITNGGVFGSMLSTPILNTPQSAILGMHNIVNRPMAIDGSVQIRPMMYLALTYDHRIIDGAQSVQFLVMVKQLLEEPSRSLLDI